MLAMASSPDYRWVVALLGYCSSDKKHHRQWWWLSLATAAPTLSSATAAPTRSTIASGGGDNRRCTRRRWWRPPPSALGQGGGCSWMVLDIACSLQFLHTMCEPLVIHSDIKPSNILLDAYLSANITDFGLARFKTPIADDLQATVVSPASNLGDDNEMAIEIMPNKAMTGDSKSFLNVKESAVGGGEDEASIMGETAESTTMAASLQFLHTVCEPLVIHSDIKPSNILLDAYLSTKITDFGLARLKTPIADDL
ncbi:putative receptor-like serine/threonine-protein kinase [Cocos nucifera]|uniref:Putative receptor-like serine/threonine-protein kinase n=1 Tax=Cocos nucifera TaxID=13894 RepID=A0A8K0N5F1_COCNU|nr:putative receptor-like serine/threonine-protein kinase [Cocos nucifera]